MNRLRSLYGPLFLSLLLAQAARAVPCLPGSLQDYIDLGVSGCTLGDATVSAFGAAPGQTFAVPIDPSLIQVTPGGSPGTAILQLNFSSSAGAGELLEAFFHFFVSAPTLFGYGVDLASASATGDGVVTATQDVCPDGFFAGNSPTLCPTAASALITFLTESDSLLSDQAGFASASSFFDVFTDVAIDGGLAGSANLGSVTLSFGPVPEPSTAALLAAGLALLARSRAGRRR